MDSADSFEHYYGVQNTYFTFETEHTQTRSSVRQISTVIDDSVRRSGDPIPRLHGLVVEITSPYKYSYHVLLGTPHARVH
jgi:hypothetical protein